MYQQPSVQFLPPNVIRQYVGQWITTSIPNYGQVVAYVIDYSRRTGMVSLFMYTSYAYQPQYIQVHHSDLVGISPYYGPIPPQPSPRPRPPYSPWYPGGGQFGGGGFWPWLGGQVGTLLGGQQQPPR
ncbi:hypothetical protein [Alkalihalobacillus urbisdiaboli]|uniref:hypothetical protein n=1 Tax=Halalkalibacter urbisdiaboli TaxID=1960589 RepID=UPI000B44B721